MVPIEQFCKRVLSASNARQGAGAWVTRGSALAVSELETLPHRL